MNGVCDGKLFFLGPWGGVKRSNIINFNYKVNFKDFLYQTLCVFSQMKDTKHIRRDIHSVAWVMPQGWDLALGCSGGQKKIFFQTLSCGISNRPYKLPLLGNHSVTEMV